jgi:hypothetical protein
VLATCVAPFYNIKHRALPDMDRLFVVAGVTQAGQYTLHKKHTSLQHCGNVQDVMAVLGVSGSVDRVHADYGLMHGYASDPTGIWSSMTATVDPATRMDALAQYLPHDVILSSDDASLPATLLKAGTFVLILDVELAACAHRHQNVFGALRDMGFADDAIQARYAQLSEEQLALEFRAVLIVMLNLLT